VFYPPVFTILTYYICNISHSFVGDVVDEVLDRLCFSSGGIGYSIVAIEDSYDNNPFSIPYRKNKASSRPRYVILAAVITDNGIIQGV